MLTPARRRQLWYLPLLACAMALMMVRSLVMARLLGVRSFAEFSGGILVSSSFGMLGCLGMQVILQRDWPVAIIRGQEIRGLVRAAQCILIAVACALIVICAVLGGLTVGTLSSGLLTMGVIHGCVQQIFVIATIESRSRGDALRFSLDNLLRALGILSVGSMVAVWTGSAIETLAAEALLTFALSAVMLYRSARYGRLGLWHPFGLALRQLPSAPWASATTLMVATGIAFLLVSVDRWAAAANLSAQQFATYSFAWIVPSVAQSAQQIINTTVYPTMVRRYASTGSASAFRLCTASSLLGLGVGAVAAVPGFYILKYCVDTWFPKYIAALPIVPIFMAVAVLRMSEFWSSFLLAAGRDGVLLLANISVMVAGVALWGAWICLSKSTPLQPADAASLALVLSGLSYATDMGCAWAVRRHDRSVQAGS